jgi:hypothetical protein
MKPVLGALALVGLSWALTALSAYASLPPGAHGRERPAQEDDVRAEALRGTWRFVATDAPGTDAVASEIELTGEGWLVSRLAGNEVGRVPYNAVPMGSRMLRLSTLHGGEVRITAVDVMADQITIHDPEKGPLVLRRAAR